MSLDVSLEKLCNQPFTVVIYEDIPEEDQGSITLNFDNGILLNASY